MAQDKLPRRTFLKGALAAAAGLAAPDLIRAAAAQPVEPGAASAEADWIVQRLKKAATPLADIRDEDFAAFIDRFADAKVILLGESTHGTDEFYRARAAITRRLVLRHGFTIVAVEADWPDAARVDAYIRGRTDLPSAISPFQSFPVWMWRNRAVLDFVDSLHDINSRLADPERKAGFYGLDLYSLPSSMDAVVTFVGRQDPAALDEVRRRFGCLAPYVDDPEFYGLLGRTEDLDTCAGDVQSVIDRLLKTRLDYVEANDQAFFDALQNARVVAASEAYYRAMVEGSVSSWNLRDTHMVQTLQAVLAARGPQSKAVVWAHNSHIGDAAATEMGRGGEINIGQLCRQAFGAAAVLIGLGADRGTVTAATDWGGPTETKTVLPSIPGSWGALFREAIPGRFFLDLRRAEDDLKKALAEWRPDRFIGVIYRPETERISHYLNASLAGQFDAYLWFEETRAVEPLPAAEITQMPAGHPLAR